MATSTQAEGTTASHSDAVYAQEEAKYFKEVDANILALAIFRGGLVQGRPTEGTASNLKEQFDTALLKVISTFKVYNLIVADPKTTRWPATNFGGDNHSLIPQQQLVENRKIKFCCQRCKTNGIWSLLGVGKFVKADKTGSQEKIGSIIMEKVFYHDKDCHKDVSGKLPAYEYSVVDFDFDEVIGDTYEPVVQRFLKCNFHDHQTSLPGHSINFGHEDYFYDDRAFEYFPSPNYSEVPEGFHRFSMVRFHYFLTTELNMSHEAAHSVLDLAKIIDHKMATGKFETCTEITNPEFHLYFYEISLLFGGHCMLKDSEETVVVDQICHKDGETHEGEISSIEQLKGKHKPGSFIIPLYEARTIYVCTPQLLVTAEKGQFIWFHGPLPHGGKTYKASPEGNEWRPAIHGHLDSIHHARKRGDFSFENSEHVYFPLEHAEFMNDIFPILEKGEDITFNALGLIHKRCVDEDSGQQFLESLTRDQLAKYNQVLCGRFSEFGTVEMDP